MEQLPVVRMRPGAEAVDRRVNQPVDRAIRRELVESDVEPRTVRHVEADVLRELDATPQARQVVLCFLIVAGQAALRESHQIVQEQPDEDVEHGELAQRPDAGLIELREPQGAVRPKHLQEYLAPVRLASIAPGEFHLRQNLHHGATLRLDDTHMVAGVEPIVSEREHRASPFAIVLREAG